jgi:H+/Cl- antiporter ClcA
MGRRKRSSLKLKSAIFWVIIIVLVMVYKLLELIGLDRETSFFELIDRYSGYAFEVFMWILVLTILFLGVRFFFRLKR